MIDERHEELASLYALDLLEGAELAQFETALARDPELRTLVRELRETSATLVHVAPAAVPPPELKARVLASVEQSGGASAAPAASAKIIAFPVLLWGLAACLAFGVTFLAVRHQTLSSELELARQEAQLLDAALQLERTRLERDRMLAQKSIGELGTKIAEADRRAADATQQLADSRTQLADKERQVATLTQRIDTLTGASAEIGRQLGEAKQRMAELEKQADLANLKITTLASMLDNSPQALAVAVWDPTKQGGVIQVGGLPALAANQDYQLWVVDTGKTDPIDGGVFTVDAKGNARFEYKAKDPVKAVAAFAISRERKGGVPKAEGPIVLLGK